MLKNKSLFLGQKLALFGKFDKAVYKREGATDGEEEMKGMSECECVGIVKRLILTLQERAV